MSIPLSFKARREQQAEGLDEHRPLSASVAEYRLVRWRPIARPVDLARTLKGFGLTLSEAHRVLDAIVVDGLVTVRLTGAPSVIASTLHSLDLDVSPVAG